MSEKYTNTSIDFNVIKYQNHTNFYGFKGNENVSPSFGSGVKRRDFIFVVYLLFVSSDRSLDARITMPRNSKNPSQNGVLQQQTGISKFYDFKA